MALVAFLLAQLTGHPVLGLFIAWERIENRPSQSVEIATFKRADATDLDRRFSELELSGGVDRRREELP